VHVEEVAPVVEPVPVEPDTAGEAKTPAPIAAPPPAPAADASREHKRPALATVADTDTQNVAQPPAPPLPDDPGVDPDDTAETEPRRFRLF
jgi:HemY protein